MAVVNNFIDDFVDQDKVFPDSLLIDDSAIISKDLHHPVDNIMHKTWRDVVLGGGNKVDTELLGEHVVEAIDVLNKFQIIKEMGYLRKMVAGLPHSKCSLADRKLHKFLSRGLGGLFQ